MQDRITRDPAVLAGKAVIRGTRISVELIRELTSLGWSDADILASYPHLTSDDLQACREYNGPMR